jgi:hypothetical protein
MDVLRIMLLETKSLAFFYFMWPWEVNVVVF